MKVGRLTQEQANTLKGLKYKGDTYYNPSVDGNGELFISQQEMNETYSAALSWIHDLPLVDYVEPTPPTQE